MELSLQDHPHHEAESLDYEIKSERPVDLVHLSRQTLGDKNLECEVLELFRRQSVGTVAKLRDAQNAEAWRRAAHSLKGSARGIGAWPVANLADQIERLAGPEMSDVTGGQVAQLEQLVSETNDYIEALLND